MKFRLSRKRLLDGLYFFRLLKMSWVNHGICLGTGSISVYRGGEGRGVNIDGQGYWKTEWLQNLDLERLNSLSLKNRMTPEFGSREVKFTLWDKYKTIIDKGLRKKSVIDWLLSLYSLVWLKYVKDDGSHLEVDKYPPRTIPLSNNWLSQSRVCTQTPVQKFCSSKNMAD